MAELNSRRGVLSFELEAYWRSLPAQGDIPSYEDFDLVEVPELLPNLVLVRITPGLDVEMSVIVAGSAILERTGTDITNRNYLDLYDKSSNASVLNAARIVASFPSGLVVYNEVSFEKAQSATMEVTFLPLKGKDNESQFLVSVIEWLGVSLTGRVQDPIRVKHSDIYEWIDLGKGVPKG